LTGFYGICAALLLASALFYLLPPLRRRHWAGEEDPAQANLAWLRQRRRELAESGDADLEDDLRLRLLEEAPPAPVAVPPGARGFPAWILLPAVALLSALLYHQLGAAPDVVLARQMAALGPDSSPAELRQLIDRIEQRAAQRPDNLHYLALLGRHYMGQEDYARARDTYEGLLQLVPDDAQALAYAAQADYLASGRELRPAARLRAEQAIAADPHQRTALGLLGMAAFEHGDYRGAIVYWERLLAMETPDSAGARMIADVVARARQQLGEDVAVASPPQQPAAGAGITVRVRLPEGAAIGPDDTVFVLARDAGGSSRMPIAVQRLSGRELPVTLRLDDSNSMAGRRISEFARVVVAVQVSPGGQPGEDNASWLAESAPVPPSDSGQPVELELRPRGS